MTARRTKRGAKPGLAHPRARFSEAEVLRIRQLAAEGATYRDLGKEYETGKTTIQHIVRGERYADVDGPIRRAGEAGQPGELIKETDRDDAKETRPRRRQARRRPPAQEPERARARPQAHDDRALAGHRRPPRRDR